MTKFTKFLQSRFNTMFNPMKYTILGTARVRKSGIGIYKFYM